MGLFKAKATNRDEPEVKGLKVQTTALGSPIPYVYGRNRLAGLIIYVGDFSIIQADSDITFRLPPETAFGGGPRPSKRFVYLASFGAALAEGPIRRVRGVFRDGKFRLCGVNTPNVGPSIPTAPLLNMPTDPNDILSILNAASGKYSPDVVAFNGASIQVGLLDQEEMYSGFSIQFVKEASFTIETKQPTPNLRYAGTATWFRGLMFLDSGAAVPNLMFEVEGFYPVAVDKPDLSESSRSAASGTRNANREDRIRRLENVDKLIGKVTGSDPADIVWDILAHPIRGVDLFAGHVGSLRSFSNYCRAEDFLMNLLLDKQKPAAEVLNQIASHTNSQVVFDQGYLNIVPEAESLVAGQSRIYVPPQYAKGFGEASEDLPEDAITPIFDITEDDIISDNGANIIVDVPSHEDTKNVVTVEYLDAANHYAVSIVDQTDDAHISIFGRREADKIQAHEYTTEVPARKLAALKVQNLSYQPAEIEITVAWKFFILSPMDIVSLTFPRFGFDRKLFRVLEIEDTDDFAIKLRLRELIRGAATAPLYAAEKVSITNLPKVPAPPLTDQVFIFEPTFYMTKGRPEIWIALGSSQPNWGGARIWMSTDGGENYSPVGEVRDSSWVGTVTADHNTGTTTVELPNSILEATLEQSGTVDIRFDIPNVQITDLAPPDHKVWGRQIPVLVGTSGKRYEIISYFEASLTGKDSQDRNSYQLGPGLLRGLLGTDVSSKLSEGSRVVFLNGPIFKLPVDRELLRSRLRFKFTSFNHLGLTEESLQDVDPVGFVFSGTRLCGNLPRIENLRLAYSRPGNNLTLNWDPVVDFGISDSSVQYEVRKFPLTTPQELLDKGLDPNIPEQVWRYAVFVGVTKETKFPIQGNGRYLVAITCGSSLLDKESDRLGMPLRYGPPEDISITNADEFLVNKVQEVQEIPIPQGGTWQDRLYSDNVATYLPLGDTPTVSTKLKNYITNDYFSGAQYNSSGDGSVVLRDSLSPLAIPQGDFIHQAARCVKGGTSGGGWIEVPNTSDSSLDFPDDDWFFILWVKEDAVASSERAFFSKDSGAILGVESGSLGSVFWEPISGGQRYTTAGIPFLHIPSTSRSAPGWKMLIVSWDKKRQEISIYGSGVLLLKTQAIEAIKTGTVYFGQKGDGTLFVPSTLFGGFSFHPGRRVSTEATAKSLWRALEPGRPDSQYADRIIAKKAAVWFKFDERPSGSVIDHAKDLTVQEAKSRGSFQPSELNLVPALLPESTDWAREFNSGVTNEKVQLTPSSLNRAVPNMESEFTFHALVKPYSLVSPPNECVVMAANSGDTNTSFYIFLVPQATTPLTFTVLAYGSNGTYIVNPISTIPIEADKPHYIAVTFKNDPANNSSTMKLYVDDQDPVEQSTVSMKLPIFSNSFMTIGNSPADAFPLTGVIDEVAIFPTALSDSRIKDYVKIALSQQDASDWIVTQAGYLELSRSTDDDSPGSVAEYIPPADHELVLSQETMLAFGATWEMYIKPEQSLRNITSINKLVSFNPQDLPRYVRARPTIRTAPNLTSGYGSAQPLDTNAYYRGQKFKLQFEVEPLKKFIIPVITSFKWVVDFPDAVLGGQHSASNDQETVTFSSSFTSPPTVIVVIIDRKVGDAVNILSTTTADFTYEIKDNNGNIVTTQRNIQWFAKGV